MEIWEKLGIHHCEMILEKKLDNLKETLFLSLRQIGEVGIFIGH